MPTFVPSHLGRFQFYGADSVAPGLSYAEEWAAVMSLAPETKEEAQYNLSHFGSDPSSEVSKYTYMKTYYDLYKEKYKHYKQKYAECAREVVAKKGAGAVWPKDQSKSIFVRNCRNSYRKWKEYENKLADLAPVYTANLVRSGARLTEEQLKDLYISRHIKQNLTVKEWNKVWEAHQAAYERAKAEVKRKIGFVPTEPTQVLEAQRRGRTVSDMTQLEVEHTQELQAARDQAVADASAGLPADSLVDDTYGDGGLVAPLLTLGAVVLVAGGGYYLYTHRAE